MEKLFQLNLPIERRKHESRLLKQRQQQQQQQQQQVRGGENSKNLATPLTTKVRDRNIDISNNSSIDPILFGDTTSGRNNNEELEGEGDDVTLLAQELQNGEASTDDEDNDEDIMDIESD